MNETVRRVGLWICSVGGWAYAVGAAVWITVDYDQTKGHYFPPQWVGLSVILVMGFAIAAGAALGRMNSVRTLARIFDAGMLAQKMRDDNEKEDVR